MAALFNFVMLNHVINLSNGLFNQKVIGVKKVFFFNFIFKKVDWGQKNLACQVVQWTAAMAPQNFKVHEFFFTLNKKR